MHTRGKFKGTTTGYNRLVFNGILGGSQSISHGILNLFNRMRIRSLQQQGTTLGMFAFFHKGKLVLPNSHFGYFTGITQHFGRQIFHGMNGRATTGKSQSFHVATFGTTQTQNTLLGKDVEGKRINALLINHDKTLSFLADVSLKVNDEFAPFIQPFAFTFHQLFSFLGIAIKESRLHFCLFIFKRDIARHDVTICQRRWHVGMTSSMIQDNSVNETRIRREFSLHRHDFNSI
mmetsp:Transcript_4365/g.8019  ORF Transcript_4365/g.8019 Transcript_4365/m.8019 type:complete len:233 (+) Transcript_4365:492-1190(+)